MPSNLPQPGDRPLPKKIGFITQGAVFEKFSFSDRLRILFGYNLLCRVNMMSQHNPGQTQPVTEMRFTKHKIMRDAMDEATLADNAAVKANAQKYAADHGQEGPK